MYGFDNNTSEIDALAKHTIAETYYFGPTVMYAPGMSKDNMGVADLMSCFRARASTRSRRVRLETCGVF